MPGRRSAGVRSRLADRASFHGKRLLPVPPHRGGGRRRPHDTNQNWYVGALAAVAQRAQGCRRRRSRGCHLRWSAHLRRRFRLPAGGVQRTWHRPQGPRRSHGGRHRSDAASLDPGPFLLHWRALPTAEPDGDTQAGAARRPAHLDGGSRGQAGPTRGEVRMLLGAGGWRRFRGACRMGTRAAIARPRSQGFSSDELLRHLRYRRCGGYESRVDAGRRAATRRPHGPAYSLPGGQRSSEGCRVVQAA